MLQQTMPTKQIVELCANGMKRQREIIDIMPGQARLMRLGYTNMIVDDSRITKLEKTIADMVEYQQRVSPSANLENCTDNARTAVDANNGGGTMAYKRMRLCIGYNDDGSAIIKQVSANSETELSDKIVATMLQSERRYEFIPKTELVTSPVTAEIAKFGVYANDWLTTF